MVKRLRYMERERKTTYRHDVADDFLNFISSEEKNTSDRDENKLLNAYGAVIDAYSYANSLGKVRVPFAATNKKTSNHNFCSGRHPM
jgi:hypothetical protein